MGQHPPPGGRIPRPDGLAAPGLVDPEDPHHRQRRGRGRRDMVDERVMDGGPPDPVVRGDLGHAPVLLGDRVGELAAQPDGEAGPGGHGVDLFGQRAPRAQPRPAPPPPLVPHQTQRRRPEPDVARPADDPALRRRRDHPARRTRRRRQIRGHHMHDPASTSVLEDLPDRQPRQIQQPRRADIRHRGNHMNLRSLGQARDLCSMTMICSLQL